MERANSGPPLGRGGPLARLQTPALPYQDASMARMAA